MLGFLNRIPSFLLSGAAYSALRLGAVFLGMCALVDLVTAAMSESDKEALQEALGPYFDACMEVGKNFAFCLLSSQYGRLDPRGEAYDCRHADLTPQGFVGRSPSLPRAYHAACVAAITPQGQSYSTCGPRP